MAHQTLKRGDKGEAVQLLQELLNKTGALLKPDGDFGRGTERAVREAREIAGLPAGVEADDALWTWLETQPDPSNLVSTADANFIAREEVGGRDYYDLAVAMPIWPEGASGITIGVGYDLRYHKTEFLNDWDMLPQDVVTRLTPYLGVKGSKEAAAGLSDIRIPFYEAWRVYLVRTLPKYFELTKSIYPQVETLPNGCKGALLSLVFNRGTDLDPESDRRSEMRNIQIHLSKGELTKVPAEFEAMKRHWTSGGLPDRRQREADLFRSGLPPA